MKKNINVKTIWVMVLLTGIFAAQAADLSPVADAFANSAAPAGFYGDGQELWVRSFDPGTINSMKIYLRFQLPADFSGVESAELVFTRTTDVSPPALPYNLHGLKKSVRNQKWKEHGGATWDNAPANNKTSTSGFTSDATKVLATADWEAGAAGTTVSIPGTKDLVDFLNGFSAGDVVTLMVAQNQETGKMNKLASRENKKYAGPVLKLVDKK
ncbi:MAG: DNRLRE domain-containing protein [Kiritimatiellales bacterium]